MNRREFNAALIGEALVYPGQAKPPVPPAAPRFRKGICSISFPRSMPFEEMFRQTRNAGFEGIEIRLGDTIAIDTAAAEVTRVGDAARKAGIEIASVWCSQPLEANPLNSPDAAVRGRGVEAVLKCIEIARLLGSGAMLIIPGRLGSGPKFRVGYEDTWNRTTGALRNVVGAAAKAKVILTPENVWSKFLVSPLEMRAYVDQFHSPWLQTHFDIGNVMQYGYPQDWILTLGPRIKRVHAKDYKLAAGAEQGRFVDLLEGDVEWKAVMGALVETGYQGFISPEYDANDPARLMQLSKQLDKILELA